MFEKSLSDLVRGIRNNKKNEGKFISQCIQEIKEELKQDMQKKTIAIQKLTYVRTCILRALNRITLARAHSTPRINPSMILCENIFIGIIAPNAWI